MVIELKNEKVTVQFKEFGGALSSINQIPMAEKSLLLEFSGTGSFSYLRQFKK